MFRSERGERAGQPEQPRSGERDSRVNERDSLSSHVRVEGDTRNERGGQPEKPRSDALSYFRRAVHCANVRESGRSSQEIASNMATQAVLLVEPGVPLDANVAAQAVPLVDPGVPHGANVVAQAVPLEVDHASHQA